MGSNALTSTILSRGFLVGLTVVLIAAASCSSSESDPTPTTTAVPGTTAPPTASDESSTTEAEISESSDTEGTSANEIIEVTFDGNICSASGPAVVPTGVHSFVVIDLTGERPADMRTMAIADGHAYQDLLDLQSEPGAYVPLPEWAEWPLTTFEPVDRELNDNESGKTLILEPGEHGITVRTDDGLWFCGALTVTES